MEQSRRAFVKSSGAAIIGASCIKNVSSLASQPNEETAQKQGRDLNVVFILSDQHRGDFIGMRGKHPQLHTPNLDKLAENGISFTNAYTSSPLCVPARPAILAGKYPCSIGFSEKNLRVPLTKEYTLPEHLGKYGYYSGHFGKGHLVHETEDKIFGFNERGLRYLYQTKDDYRAIVGEEFVDAYLTQEVGEHDGNDKRCYNSEYKASVIPSPIHFDTILANTSANFFWKNRRKNFYAQIGIEKPHPFWYPPKEFTDAIDPATIKLPENWRKKFENVPYKRISRQKDCWDMGYRKERQTISGTEGWSEQEAKNALASYIACINYTDYVVGQIIDSLKKFGLYEKTLIIYSSDHGEFCLDHGLFQKHCCLEPAINVNMILSGPGIKKTGEYSKGLAEHIDIFPTVCDYLGIPKPDGLQGESLLPTITEGVPPKKKVAYAEFFRSPEAAVRSLEYCYIEHGDDERVELYDMLKDPQQNVNVAYDAEYKDVLTKMKLQFDKRRKEINYG